MSGRVAPHFYRALADCIRTGQVPDDEVIKIMEGDPEFARWYRERYGLVRS